MRCLAQKGWVLGLLFLAGAVHAAEQQVKIKVTVIRPACLINKGQRIDVNFGDRVGVNKVDGVNYRQPVNYSITCEPGGKGLVMALVLTGIPSGFDNAAVSTNVKDLGIRLTRDGLPFTLGSPVPISVDKPPVLMAAPVKRASAKLKAGEFEATATLQAVYQ